MEDVHLPIQYRIELYEGSFGNDPTASFETSTPPFSIHAGDYIEPRVLDTSLLYSHFEPGEVFRVKAVKHLVWKVATHVGHSLSVLVEVAPDPT